MSGAITSAPSASHRELGMDISAFLCFIPCMTAGGTVYVMTSSVTGLDVDGLVAGVVYTVISSMTGRISSQAQHLNYHV
jgi:hypothetical protein